MPEAVAAPPPRLAELPESGASGATLHIYGELKRLSAVPMVALIYRHLATIPGALAWSWALLEPVMRAGLVQQQAAIMSFNDVMLVMSLLCAFAVLLLPFADKPQMLGAAGGGAH